MKATTKWVALMTLLPLAAACGGGDGAAGSAVPQDTAATAVVPPATDGTMPPAATEPMPVGGNVVTLQQVGGSGVGGEATFTAQGEQTMVMVTLTNAPQGPHAGHIHRGTCDNVGPPVAPLQEIAVAQANGTGSSHSTVDVPLATAANGQHVVAYHERGGDAPGAPIVCGAIPAQGGAAGAATDTGTTAM